MARRVFLIAHGDCEHRVEVEDDGEVCVDGQTLRVERDVDGTLRVETNQTIRVWAIAAGDTRWVFANGSAFELRVHQTAGRARRGGVHHGSLMSPMPATVRRIDAAVGQAVKRGDTLILLEAMKMELPVRATADGVVEAVNCREGELVQPGTPLIDIAEATEA